MTRPHAAVPQCSHPGPHGERLASTAPACGEHAGPHLTDRGGEVMATMVIHDDMFTDDVIADPYAYYGHLREEDPVHLHDKYALWVITRHEDVVWMTRHHELFSNAFFRNDPRPAYPAIPASDEPLYDYVRQYQADKFIQFDRPEHLEMRKVVHSYFTPRAMEAWRGFVKNAITELLDAA